MKKELEQGFVLCGKTASPILIDSNDECASALELYARTFANDVELVTGKKPEVYTSLEKAVCDDGFCSISLVLAGTAGSSALLQNLAANGKIDLSPLTGMYETYIIQFVDNPFPGIERALVIAGADQLGCAYGFFHLSGKIGVSPWYWFADAVPQKQQELILLPDVQTVSKEPAVHYRGIFINDEAPSCTTWAYGKFGGYNEDFYSHVFELIIRLRGNCLWPAMWNNVLFEDGKISPDANMKLASLWGVYTGTSHHEPLCRAGAEWQRVYTRYGKSNAWDFKANAEAITAFWFDGLMRYKNYKQIITLGMRGENDSVLGGSLEYNIQLLKEIICVQKKLLAKAGMQDRPQVLVVYKEVEKFWNGGFDSQTGRNVQGLRDWKNPDGTSILDDVIIMLCEDNYGNVRALPPINESRHTSGWGMYYHFDYHGGPRDYMWINIIQLEKAWEQLSLAYSYGVNAYWIVNVGDLKPMELPMSFYMDLAFDGAQSVNPQSYYRTFIDRQFGKSVPLLVAENAARLLQDYTYLNTVCRSEHAHEDVFSLDSFNEAERMLSFCTDMITRTASLKAHIPLEMQDAYYQLVAYPACASANICRMYIYYAKNLRFAQQGDIRAEWYAEKTHKCIEFDTQLQDYYNNTLSGGKWQGLMSQVHYGYCNWNSEGATQPVPVRVSSELLPRGTFLWEGSCVSMRADRFIENICSTNAHLIWKVIPNYGRFGASVTASINGTRTHKQQVLIGAENLSCLKYSFYTAVQGSVTVRVYTSPANNLQADRVELRFGLAIDKENMRIIDSLPKNFVAGDYDNEPWCIGVIQSGRYTECTANVSPGRHSLMLYAVDEGLSLQKIVIYSGTLSESYLGPEESLEIGSKIEKFPLE